MSFLYSAIPLLKLKFYIDMNHNVLYFLLSWKGVKEQTQSYYWPFAVRPPFQQMFQYPRSHSWGFLSECPASCDSQRSRRRGPSCLVAPWRQTQTRLRHLPSLTCTAEAGQWGRIQKHIKPDILRFYEINFFSMQWIAIQIWAARIPEPRQLC